MEITELEMEISPPMQPADNAAREAGTPKHNTVVDKSGKHHTRCAGTAKAALLVKLEQQSTLENVFMSTMCIIFLIFYTGFVVTLLGLMVAVLPLAALGYIPASATLAVRSRQKKQVRGEEGKKRFRHSKLEDHPHAFRLITMPSQNCTTTFNYGIEHRRFTDGGYRAVSYAWETTRDDPFVGFSTSATTHGYILANSSTIRTSLTVKRALRYIQNTQDPRPLWIDAICIDQNIPASWLREVEHEKPDQVQKMKDIYQNADEVVVWLDVDLDSLTNYKDPDLRSLFDKLRHCSSPEMATVILDTLSSKELTILNHLLGLRWWQRTWIIQEIAVNAKVVFQCRSEAISWEAMSSFVLGATQGSSSYKPSEAPHRLLKWVTALRSADTDPACGLLELLHGFSEAQVGEPCDRIFALKGLIKTNEHALDLKVTYEEGGGLAYANFVKSYVAKYRLLNVLIRLEFDKARRQQNRSDEQYLIWLGTWLFNTGLAQRYLPPIFLNKLRTHWRLPSWTTRWDLDVELTLRRTTLWTGSLDIDAAAAGAIYKASGGVPLHSAQEVPLDEVLIVQGWRIGEVVAVGSVFEATHPAKKRVHTLEQWERMAGGPWTGDNNDESIEFCRILIGGNANIKSLVEWRDWHGTKSAGHECSAISNAVCTGRRFITTQCGKLGLGHANTRRGDLVCILLGADVPYILRKTNHESALTLHHSQPCRFSFECKLRTHLGCCLPPLHLLVGQAYVHGSMHYHGDVMADIESEVIKLENFGLE